MNNDCTFMLSAPHKRAKAHKSKPKKKVRIMPDNTKAVLNISSLMQAIMLAVCLWMCNKVADTYTSVEVIKISVEKNTDAIKQVDDLLSRMVKSEVLIQQLQARLDKLEADKCAKDSTGY